jgi:hypothetical protein
MGEGLLTLVQLLQSVGFTAVLMACVPGIPVTAYMSLRGKPRRLVLWPIAFAGLTGALAPPLSLIVYLVAHHH